MPRLPLICLELRPGIYDKRLCDDQPPRLEAAEIPEDVQP